VKSLPIVTLSSRMSLVALRAVDENLVMVVPGQPIGCLFGGSQSESVSSGLYRESKNLQRG
jgi:hypothetical protein